MNILVTGAHGFIGRNLSARLETEADLKVIRVGSTISVDELDSSLQSADLIFHLAGVNRPKTDDEFQSGNVDFTRHICERLKALGRSTPIVFSSSSQIALDNPYGQSKKAAEDILIEYAQAAHAYVVIYRLKNVFGKWCRPNYNSVVATFCYNISHDLPISISDHNKQVQLVYVDDVVDALISELRVDGQRQSPAFGEVAPCQTIDLGSLADLIQSFRQMRQTLVVPEFEHDFNRKLYATYLSYLDEANFGYELQKRCDARGCLAEFVKSPHFGQIFVSRTLPGITRGNHYHHTKVEKFLVLEGQAIIRFRHIESQKVIEYRVAGEDFKVLDIPPGYTHSIENTGSNELVTLFWASEVFDPTRPDTRMLRVLG